LHDRARSGGSERYDHRPCGLPMETRVSSAGEQTGAILSLVHWSKLDHGDRANQGGAPAIPVRVRGSVDDRVHSGEPERLSVATELAAGCSGQPLSWRRGSVDGHRGRRGFVWPCGRERGFQEPATSSMIRPWNCGGADARRGDVRWDLRLRGSSPIRILVANTVVGVGGRAVRGAGLRMDFPPAAFATGGECPIAAVPQE
jgi:hypothetical protein